LRGVDIDECDIWDDMERVMKLLKLLARMICRGRRNTPMLKILHFLARLICRGWRNTPSPPARPRTRRRPF